MKYKLAAVELKCLTQTFGSTQFCQLKHKGI